MALPIMVWCFPVVMMMCSMLTARHRPLADRPHGYDDDDDYCCCWWWDSMGRMMDRWLPLISKWLIADARILKLFDMILVARSRAHATASNYWNFDRDLCPYLVWNMDCNAFDSAVVRWFCRPPTTDTVPVAMRSAHALCPANLFHLCWPCRPTTIFAVCCLCWNLCCRRACAWFRGVADSAADWPDGTVGSRSCSIDCKRRAMCFPAVIRLDVAFYDAYHHLHWTPFHCLLSLNWQNEWRERRIRQSIKILELA